MPEKSDDFDTKLSLFSVKSVLTAGINLLRRLNHFVMKSDFVGLKWTDLISPKPKGFDFIRPCSDFAVSIANDFAEHSHLNDKNDTIPIVLFCAYNAVTARLVGFVGVKGLCILRLYIIKFYL